MLDNEILDELNGGFGFRWPLRAWAGGQGGGAGSSTSPFGATTSVAYNDTASPPNTCTSVNGRWTETQLDGLGRPSLTLTGYGSSCGSGTIVSQAATTYDSCGCSPLGKMMSQEVPHLRSVTAPNIAMTNYTYDGIGRTLTKAAVGAGSTPDTQGTTHYVYWGQSVTVTDPVGNWKEFAMDAFGNLIQVVEPKPATDTSSWSGNYVTNYTYDVLNHLTGVSMVRSTGTQTRSFVYNGNQLTSATNAESGTVSYTYNSYGKVATRTDAKSQEVVYSYDSYARLSEVQRYPTSGTEDTCQREVYYYDGTNPLSSTYPQNALGHLSAVQYWGGYNPNVLPTCDTTFTEMFTYDATSGAPVGKQLTVSRGGSTQTINLNATSSYDNEGRMTGETYPTDHGGSTANLSYTFDSMGRLNTMTDNVASQTVVASASYGPANELLSLTGGGPYYYGFWGGESRTYNSLKQLTEVDSLGLGIQYNYPSTGNNGKISSQTDTISGEQVSYTYDALNRLATAENQSTFTPLWGQGFSYDGFGNLTGVRVTQGSAPTLTGSYDANNHAGGEDANGNPGYVPVPAYGTSDPGTYDVENRLVVVNGSGYVPAVFYSYAPGNKRLWRGGWSYSGSTWTRTTDEITFWSLNGQKLATYALTTTTSLIATETGTNYYFGSKLIKNNNGWVYSDRLASIGKFYPYGMERPSATTNGTEKFTGYFRDSDTGNDYADQRYMTPGYGRFLTPDRSANPKADDPGSWNLYAYVGGDPITRTDPSGQDWCDAFFTSYNNCDGIGPDDNGVCDVLTSIGGLMVMEMPGCGEVIWGDPVALGGPGPCGDVLSFADSGCGGGGGGVVGTPVAYQPNCTIQMYTRVLSGVLGVLLGLTGTHSYLVVTETGDPTETFDGRHAGKLLKGAAATQGYGQGNSPGNIWTNVSDGPPMQIPCSDRDALEQDTTSFDLGPSVTYHALGPNSNSYLHWLLNQVGLGGDFSEPIGAWGWNTPIPGFTGS